METKYTIIVKKKDTGEVLLEKDTNAMIGALTVGDDASSILLRGTHEENLIVMNVVQNEMNRMYEDE